MIKNFFQVLGRYEWNVETHQLNEEEEDGEEPSVRAR